MRVVFDSSHVTGDFSGGFLMAGIQIEDEALGQTLWDEAEFSVPPDYHVHNDCVAAALMTLVGTRYDEVEFNFPISAQCAEILGRYYQGVEIGPVDPNLEPRRPGRKIALNFSGGLDSTAALHLLRRLVPDDLAVVTAAYGGFFAFEEQGYSRYPRDVTCRTNVRRRRLDRAGRFNCAVPLLFADVLGLGRFTTGHTINQSLDCLDPLRDGRRPEFLADDQVVNAAGIDEVHLVRSLHNFGLSKLLLALAPEAVEAALAGTFHPATAKHYTKAVLLIFAYEDAGLPLPPSLRDLPMSRELIAFGMDLGMDLRLLHFVKREGMTRVRRFVKGMARLDLSFLDGLSLRFLERYHPVLAGLVPPDLRPQTLDLFHACGLAPYDERDRQEIAAVRQFLASAGVSYLPKPG